MIDLSVDDLMQKLYRRLGMHWQSTHKKANFSDTAVSSDFEGRKAVELDVRPIIDERIDPFEKIFEALSALQESQYLELVNYFEPIPLYKVLSARGYVWRSRQEETTWRVKIVLGFLQSRRKAELGEARYVPVEQERLNEIFDMIQKATPERYYELDVRDLPAPEPLSRIMEHLQKEPPPLAIKVLHRRKPDLLPRVAADYSMSVSVYEEKGCTSVYVYAASLLHEFRKPGSPSL